MPTSVGLSSRPQELIYYAPFVSQNSYLIATLARGDDRPSSHNLRDMAVVVKTNGIPFWGRCTTHFRTFLGGDWDVHWVCGILTRAHMELTTSHPEAELTMIQYPPTTACRTVLWSLNMEKSRQVGTRVLASRFLFQVFVSTTC